MQAIKSGLAGVAGIRERSFDGNHNPFFSCPRTPSCRCQQYCQNSLRDSPPPLPLQLVVSPIAILLPVLLCTRTHALWCCAPRLLILIFMCFLSCFPSQSPSMGYAAHVAVACHHDPMSYRSFSPAAHKHAIIKPLWRCSSYWCACDQRPQSHSRHPPPTGTAEQANSYSLP